jgi:hypothetical protein
MCNEIALFAIANEASASESTAGIVTLATAVVGLVATVVKLLLKLNFERERTVSTGLAIGYYYNFIQPIFEQLKVNGELEVSIQKKDSDQEERRQIFKASDLDIEIIVPAELTKPGIEAAHNLAKGLRKGKILFKNDEQRQFTIKFLLGDENRLVIRDVATPLNAVREYIENLDAFKTNLSEGGGRTDKMNSKKFRDRQKKEIDNFVEMVKFYIQKDGHADKKYSFKSP